MPPLDLTRDAVRQAMADFDKVGRDAFLAEHGFRPARQYFLFEAGRFYDSKAIAGSHPRKHDSSFSTASAPADALVLAQSDGPSVPAPGQMPR